MKQFTIKINLLVLILFVLTDPSCEGLFNCAKSYFQNSEQINISLEVGKRSEQGIDSCLQIKEHEFTWENEFSCEIDSLTSQVGQSIMIFPEIHI